LKFSRPEKKLTDVARRGKTCGARPADMAKARAACGNDRPGHRFLPGEHLFAHAGNGGREVVMRVLKYGLLVLGGILWLAGLSDQLHSFEMTARYLFLSGAILVVATV